MADGVDRNFSGFSTKEEENMKERLTRMEKELCEMKIKLENAEQEIKRLEKLNANSQEAEGEEGGIAMRLQVRSQSSKEWCNKHDGEKTVDMKEIIKEQEDERERETQLGKQMLEDKAQRSTYRGNTEAEEEEGGIAMRLQVRSQTSKEWCNKHDGEKTVDMKEIIKEQEDERERETQLGKQMLEDKAQRSTYRGNTVRRDTFDKNKSIVIIGDIEGHQEDRYKRARERRDRVNHILGKMSDGNSFWASQVVETRRIGRYERNSSRPIRVKFRSKTVAEEVLGASWKLSYEANYRKIYLRQDLDKDERERLGDMLKQVKVLNEHRSEEEKQDFFWRVKHMRIRQWFINWRD